MERIDAHQHFWRYRPDAHAWITDDMTAIKHDFLPEHLHPVLLESRIAGCVAVQAEQNARETEWLLSLAAKNPWIRGVVGWVDLIHPEVESQIEQFAENPKFSGVRHIAQSEPDEFLLRSDFRRGIALLSKFGLTYDILVYSRQLSAALDLVRAFPDQPFVLDHLAKPDIKNRVREPWLADFRKLAVAPNVYCKISGMVTEAAWRGWHEADFSDYLKYALDAFGADRLMFGSDWPVCLVAASHLQVLHIVENYYSELSEHERRMIFGGNARSFYDL
ncbi:MAG: amidohydrolase family protein [Planctomycetes bacterium]|nr:amidohydrolase family protein [Planctomycetota bacterium]